MATVVMIEIDAMAHRYLSRERTPFLWELSQKSLFGTTQPADLYPCGCTHYTGCNSDKHGAVGVFVYDPKNSPFRAVSWFAPALNLIEKILPDFPRKAYRFALTILIKKITGNPNGSLFEIPLSVAKYFRPKMDKLLSEQKLAVPTIFDILRERDVKFAWMGLTHADTKKRQAYGSLYSNRDPFSWINEAVLDGSYRVIMCPTGSEIDKIGHNIGFPSPEMDKVLRKFDDNLKTIYENLVKKHEKYMFVVMTDHGMMKIRKHVNVLEHLKKHGLKQPRDYVVFLDSVIARFWFKDDSKKEKIKNALSSLDGGHVMSNEEIAKWHLPDIKDHPENGELYYLIESGNLILPNYWQRDKACWGMHGYLHRDVYEDMGLILINTHRGEIGEIQGHEVDVVPTILDFLGMPIPDYIDGTSFFKLKKDR